VRFLALQERRGGDLSLAVDGIAPDMSGKEHRLHFSGYPPFLKGARPSPAVWVVSPFTRPEFVTPYGFNKEMPHSPIRWHQSQWLERIALESLPVKEYGFSIMTDWFGEVRGPRPIARAAAWVLAIGISVGVNWTGARQLDAAFDGLSQREASKPKQNREIEVWVEPMEQRFVEANPNRPSNVPDETNNFAARDQQAAEPDPDPTETSEFPMQESDDQSQTILERGDTRDQFQPGIYSDAVPEQPPVEAGGGTLGELAPQVERETPEWVQPAKEGSGTRIPTPEKGEEKESDEPDKRAGTIVLNDGPLESTREEQSPSVNNPSARPLPRKKVGAEVLLAPINQSKTRASRQGEIGVNSRLTDFGDYTQRALEAIQAEWHRLIREVSVGSESTYSSVTVVFYIDKSGSIDEAKIDKSTAGDLGTMICLDAIHARAPYGPWTKDMIRTLGDRTKMEITFHYR